ncbi:MAG: MerR family DNA-binding transcriptional regulator [Solobacterium sp.]|nr:MerR family DNA-binding transcriptional regulator [Solobacterium sp.]
MKYTFSQMVSLSGVRPDTLRYCEQVGFIKIKRDDKGYRYFDDMQKILE